MSLWTLDPKCNSNVEAILNYIRVGLLSYHNSNWYIYTGSSHATVPLDDSEASLIEIINDKKFWIFDKEESFLDIEKALTNKLSEFDGKADEMVDKLHAARDKQVGYCCYDLHALDIYICAANVLLFFGYEVLQWRLLMLV